MYDADLGLRQQLGGEHHFRYNPRESKPRRGGGDDHGVFVAALQRKKCVSDPIESARKISEYDRGCVYGCVSI